MGGEVFPSAPGWLGTDASSSSKASAGVGCRRAQAPTRGNSIAHAGSYTCDARRAAGSARCRSPGWLAHGRSANPRRVQAVSDACMMMEHELFERAAASRSCTSSGGDEGGDLCLRLADDAEVWYVAGRGAVPAGRGTAPGSCHVMTLASTIGCSIAGAATPGRDGVDEPAAEAGRATRLPAIPVRLRAIGAPSRSWKSTHGRARRRAWCSTQLRLLPSADAQRRSTPTPTHSRSRDGRSRARAARSRSRSANGDETFSGEARQTCARPDVGGEVSRSARRSRSGFQFVVSSLGASGRVRARGRPRSTADGGAGAARTGPRPAATCAAAYRPGCSRC